MHYTAPATHLYFLCDRRLSDRDFALKPTKIGFVLHWDSILRRCEQHICSFFTPLHIPFLAQYGAVWNSSQISARVPWQTFKWLRFHANNRWLGSQIAITSTSVIPYLRDIGWSYIVRNAVPETGYARVQRTNRYIVGNCAIYCPKVGASLFSPGLKRNRDRLNVDRTKSTDVWLELCSA